MGTSKSVLGALCLATACTGILDDGTSGSPDADGGSSTRDVLGKKLKIDEAPLPARVARLNQAEYQNSVRHLLELPADFSWLSQPQDANPHASNVLLVGDQTAAYYFTQAEAIANSLAEAALAELGGCPELTTSCGDTFLPRVLERAFRRPVTSEEIASYREVFDLASQASDPSYAFRAVLSAVLVSPNFLYRTELGPRDGADDVFDLDDYELASLLSYGILGQPPSVELLAAAASGALSDPETLDEVVLALLQAPEAATRLQEFFGFWLHLEHFPALVKDTTAFPGFDDDIANLMYLEARTFLEGAGQLDERAATLLTARVPAVDPRLDAFYASASDSPGERVGALALGGVLSEHARTNLGSPVLRGLFVQENILCGHIQPAPADVNTQLELPGSADDAGASRPATTRQIFEQHLETPACQSCHRYIDPFGYLFEHFDGAGRHRTHENGVPIDTSVEIQGTTDLDGPVAEYQELMERMSGSADYLTCLALQVFSVYYGYSGRFQSIADRLPVAVADAGSALATSDGRLREMVRALFTSETLRHRRRN